MKPMTILARIWSNWLTLLGATIGAAAGAAIVLLLAFEFIAGRTNPYATTLLVLILPSIFLGGLFLAVGGLVFEWRRRKRGEAPGGSTFELFRAVTENPRARRLIRFFAVAAVGSIGVIGIGSNQAITYMDSPKFCGTTCHVQMKPEWTSYQNAKHSHVACVECHIGKGASWEAKSKVEGVSQVWHVVTGTYEHPIPTPIAHLRSARDTCERCHWPEQFIGNRLHVFPHFLPDEKNTPSYDVFVMRIGGRNARTGEYEGIHWHVGHDAQVRFQYYDAAQTKIGEITVVEGGKVVAAYGPPDKLKALPVLGERTMDCIDCHNRPTHVFDASPRAAVDRVMAAGRLDSKTPWLAKASAAVLSEKSIPAGADARWFRSALADAYAKDWPAVKPSPSSLDQAAATLTGVYASDIFPTMGVSWGTHRSHLGHANDYDDAPEYGCFRCHDGDRTKTMPDGTKVALDQDCDKCHDAIAGGEDPATFDPQIKELLP